MKKLILLIIFILIINGIPIYAAPLDFNSETIAVYIVIDTSGSMYHTDPNRLREDVADAFIEFLSPDDYLGIITFNDKVDLIIPMTQLKDETIKNSFREQLSPKLYGTSTTNTNYNSGLEEAYRQLNEFNNPGASKVIIFLTDGKPDPNPVNITYNSERMANYMNELWNIVENIVEAHISVYSIGFSDGIDIEVLNRIANETNGDVRIFKDSAELDANLVQMLKSRETIVEELLTPASTSDDNVNVVPTPGNISLIPYEKNLLVKNGERLSIPIRLNNISAYKETILVELEEGFGTLMNNQIEIESNENKLIQLEILMNSGLKNRVHNVKLKFKPLNPKTKLDVVGLEYNIEVVSSLQNLIRQLKSNAIIILPILGIVLGMPLLIFILGMFLYLALVKPQLKIRGKLTYWEEANQYKKELMELNKKEKILITFDSTKPADFRIEGSRFLYDIELSKVLVKKGLKFVLGWKALFSKKGMAELVVTTTKPGIIEYEGDIYTKINLYNDDEFASGAFKFRYSKTSSKWSKEAEEGKNVLEGRV